MIMKKTLSITLSLIALSFLSMRSFAREYPQDVEKALEKAGENRSQIEQAIDYFISTGDKLKLEAVYFLVKNMPDHNYTRFIIKNSSGIAVPFDPLAYPDYTSMVKAWDETEKKYGSMDWKLLDKVEDISSMTGVALIRNVELAFKAWRSKPWSVGVPFEDFLQYILPYRSTNEPLEDWRGYFLEKYKYLPSKMKKPDDLVEAAALINDDIKKWFKFDPIFYRHPTDQGLSEMLKRKAGRCEDMANLAIFALRANGIPVAEDYTPFWADTGKNHAWNALVLPGGKSVPFMGAMENPGIYKLSNKPAKVYRKTFSRQQGSLAASLKTKEPLPKWFNSEDYRDVTAEYMPVGRIEIKMEEPPAKASRTPYLAVFNSGKWEIIGWGSVENGKSYFENFAKGIAYLPVYYSTVAVIPAGDPFIYTSSGEVHILSPSDRMIDVKVILTTGRTIEHATDNIAKSNLIKGRIYELYYWGNKDWRLVGSMEAGDTSLTFSNVPAGALLWLKEKGSSGEERIFTYEEGKQFWW